MQIKAAVYVDQKEDIGRSRRERMGCMPEGRGLAITIRDLRLVFAEPVATWLLAMLAAVIAPESETALRQGTVRRTLGARAADGPAVRIRVVVHVYRSGELGRPRWEGAELIVTAGDLVLRFSEPAARQFLRALMGSMARNERREDNPSDREQGMSTLAGAERGDPKGPRLPN